MKRFASLFVALLFSISLVGCGGDTGGGGTAPASAPAGGAPAATPGAGAPTKSIPTPKGPANPANPNGPKNEH